MADIGVVAAPRGLVTTAAPAYVPLLAAVTVGSSKADLRMAATDMDFADMDFADFYAATFHGLCLQLFVYTGDLSTAQDVVQEAFCRALPRWSTLSTYDDPAAWVRKVAWNLATSRWRQLRKFAGLGHVRDQVVEAPGVERIDLMNALATLPPRQRQAVVLHYLADASIAEIAVITGTAEGTIKSWLHRARANLAGQLTRDGETRAGETGSSGTPTTDGKGVRNV
jgi:RNA polymerase sigma-70 factor, ECF subfamily